LRRGSGLMSLFMLESGLNNNLMQYLRVFFLLGAVFPIVGVVRYYAVSCLSVVGVSK